MALIAMGVVLAWAVPKLSNSAMDPDKVPVKTITAPGDEPGSAISSPPEGKIAMPAERIVAQGIELAAAGQVVLVQVLTVPGTITLDPGRVARVPGRVEGTVTQMRKRLGDPVASGEIVAVLDSREVADAKSEYLTAQVALDLQRTMFDRQRILWAQKSNAELQYLQAKESFLESDLRLSLARQKLVALDIDPAQVEKAAKQESAPNASVSSLREYEIHSLISGRVIERRVDVGQLVGRQGDPTDLYTVADLSAVWVELAVPTADLEMISEGQEVAIASGRDSGKTSRGRIIFVSPLIDPDTRSARIIAEVGNQSLAWRPGAAVTASIEIKQERVDVGVPRASLQTIGSERVVFARTPDGFQKRAVTLGRSDEQTVEITSGLTVGEEVAAKNSFLLKAELGKGQAGQGD